MENSILKSVKKTLGLAPEYTAYDEDILLFTNGALAILTQLGVGPEDGVMLEDDLLDWDTFLGDDRIYNMVKPFVCLKVRLAFDPPATSFAINAIEGQLEEMEWRISNRREEKDWTAPKPVRKLPVVIDGGSP